MQSTQKNASCSAVHVVDQLMQVHNKRASLSKAEGIPNKVAPVLNLFESHPRLAALVM